MEQQTIEQIKSNFPNEWVLIGNPDLGDPQKAGSIISKLVSGVVLYHSKDKREIAYKTKELTENIERFTCIYTGNLPKNRRIWL
jgi:hypothetical protein